MNDDAIQTRLNALAKPPGSLGRLEWIAAQLCRIQKSLRIMTKPRRLVIFAGDHGCVASGVSAWPSAVTQVVMRAIENGQAGSSVLAKSTHTDLQLVYAGATRDLADDDAMTVDEFDQAWALGERDADQAVMDGMKIVAAGEVGIGNTTPASCLSILLANVPEEFAVGRGAGADDQILAKKRVVVKNAVERAKAIWHDDPKRAIASVAGHEIVAMAGFYARAATLGLVIVLDGYVATAGMLIAQQFFPKTRDNVIAAHGSAEPGHEFVLRHLNLQPILNDWQLRLGEGTGALLAMPMLDSAAAMMNDMATLAELGVGP